jgi:hypothetical protein
MKIIKVIAGLGCFIAALLPGGLALLALSNLDATEKLSILGFASILLILTIGLICAGCFLIVRRNVPMSIKARILTLSTCLFAAAFIAIIPNFIKARSTSAANACVNNLRQIDAAANQFALEHNLTNGSPINFPNDLTPYIKLNSAGKIPSCPQGGIYHISKVGETPTCSLATNGFPWHALP